MMNLRFRDGIALLEIQGVWILAADETARQYCRLARVLNDSGALICNEILQNHSIDSIIHKMSENFDEDDHEKLADEIRNFIEELRKLNYLISDNPN